MKNQKKTPEKVCNIIEISELERWKMGPVDKYEDSKFKLQCSKYRKRRTSCAKIGIRYRK